MGFGTRGGFSIDKFWLISFLFWDLGFNYFIVDWLGRYLIGQLDQFALWSCILVYSSTFFIHTAQCYEFWVSNDLNWLIEVPYWKIAFKKKIKPFYVDFCGILLVSIITSLDIMRLLVEFVNSVHIIFCSKYFEYHPAAFCLEA